jgi:hypothetical protein
MDQMTMRIRMVERAERNREAALMSTSGQRRLNGELRACLSLEIES